MYGLVDTGCTTSVVTKAIVSKGIRITYFEGPSIEMMNSQCVKAIGFCYLLLRICGVMTSVRAFVIGGERLPRQFDIILGNDITKAMGGVYVDQNLDVWFPKYQNVVFKRQVPKPSEVGTAYTFAGRSLKTAVILEEDDFNVVFDGKVWILKWKWKNGEVNLKNRCASYGMKKEHRSMFDNEVKQWIEDGWLELHDPQKHGSVRGLIAFQAKAEPRKGRVRPIMDYRELNGHIKNYPGIDCAVCPEKLRIWRRKGVNVKMLDLKKAYLQVYVAPELRNFQCVQFQGKTYVMTRMGFGLCIAPKVMGNILKHVLSLDPVISADTDNYIDDIICCEDRLKVEQIREHLNNHGLATKEADPLDGARVLGLRLEKKNQQFWWRRDTPDEPLELPSPFTKRGIYSLCGRLVGHYPVAGWLRVACNYLKRICSEFPFDKVELPANFRNIAEEILSRVVKNDPVKGIWSIPSTVNRGVVWADASSIAYGVALEIGGNIVEDGSWLRAKDSTAHINTAELDATIRGINLALKWGLSNIMVNTDSATVHGWLRAVIKGTHRIKIGGLTEMVTRRRLDTVAELMKEYKLSMDVTLVPTHKNIADALTRVPKSWLSKNTENKEICGLLTAVDIKDLHDRHHFGVKRTMFMAKRIFGEPVRKDLVRKIISDCGVCQSTDPAPIKWEKGKLQVEVPWQRLAVDVTHFKNILFLTCIDCFSRYTIWKKISKQSADIVVKALRQIFLEHGAPMELLSDNAAVFRGSEVKKLCDNFGIKHIFSGAYYPQGNGLIERNHRTIKQKAARSGKEPEEIVYVYNCTPNEGRKIPFEACHKYFPRLPGEMQQDVAADETNTQYLVGMKVYVKPESAKCTDQWPEGTVTGIVSRHSIEVDGMPRHISHLRPVPDTGKKEDENEADETPWQEVRRSRRKKKQTAPFQY